MCHLFQVGAGSGGMVVLDLLARDPRISRVTLVEPDVYKPHNVHRHLFPASVIGEAKGKLAADWLRERRPDLTFEILPVDLTDPTHAARIESAVSCCDVGVCAADNEPAKYAFDQFFRRHGKPWTLGEVLSGGIGGWIHRFTSDGPCYGCVASHLQRTAPGEPAAPRPDYANTDAAIPETTVPAPRASINAIASLHALMTLDLLTGPIGNEFTSLLVALARVQEIFDEPYRTFRFTVTKSLSCLICSAIPPPSGEDLDAALHKALARLAHD